MKRPADNPALPSLLLFAGMVVAGFVAMGLGWRVAARTLNVAVQVPAVVSGGLGGLVLIVIGTGLFVAQLGRAAAAEERTDLDDVLDRTSEVIQAVRSAGGER
ncbi:MAG TPA: hypothetical protein VG899_04545 [Mycobacteriales bacterium]|nr:hypothetical protein [Mycobacteriales bacterium]